MNEEVKIRVGMDATAMGSAMRSIDSTLKSWGEGLVNSFKSFGAGMIGAFTVGAALNQIKGALRDAETVTREAGSMGISTGFLQDLKNIAAASGMAEEAITKMFQQMLKKMTPGENPEDYFFRTAESLMAIEDPAARAQAAFDRFGKSGYALLELLGDGKTSLRDLASEFNKLTDEEINALNKLDAIFDKLENRTKIFVAKNLAFAVEHWKEIIGTMIPPALFGIPVYKGFLKSGPQDQINTDSIRARQAIADSQDKADRIDKAQKLLEKEAKAFSYSVMTNQQKHFSLSMDQESLRNAIDEETDSEKALELLREYNKLWREIYELEEKMRQDREKEIDHQKKLTEEKRKQQEHAEKEVNAQRLKYQESTMAMANQLAGDAKFSIEDLANQNFNPAGRAAANRVMQLRQWAKMNMMTFNPQAMELGRNQLMKADEMVNSMSNANPFLINPMAELLQAANQQRDALLNLLQAAGGGGGGIVVQAKD